MKLMRCPINGFRPVSEFHYAGEIRAMPDPDACADSAWTDYVFNRNGAPGIKKEWWLHLASGIWFVAERNTVTDEVQRTYLYGEEPE